MHCCVVVNDLVAYRYQTKIFIHLNCSHYDGFCLLIASMILVKTTTHFDRYCSLLKLHLRIDLAVVEWTHPPMETSLNISLYIVICNFSYIVAFGCQNTHKYHPFLLVRTRGSIYMAQNI